MRALVEGRRDHRVSDTFVRLHGRILFDDSITPSTRALILMESESISGTFPDLEYRYWEMAHARTALLQARV
jgi:hypothetical protein